MASDRPNVPRCRRFDCPGALHQVIPGGRDGQAVIYSRMVTPASADGTAGVQCDLWQVRPGDPDGPIWGIPAPQRLTQTATAQEMQAAVAPDGATVAFIRGFDPFSGGPQSFEVFTLTRPPGPAPPVTAAQTLCPCTTPVALQALGEPAWAPGLP